jgi:hypothetical protein
VPYKPEGFNNFVNSLRWAARVPAPSSNVQEVVIQTTGNASMVTAPLLHPTSALRRLQDMPRNDPFAQNATLAGGSVLQERTADPELTPLLEPEEAYRTIVSIAALFGFIVVVHAGTPLPFMLHAVFPRGCL